MTVYRSLFLLGLEGSKTGKLAQGDTIMTETEFASAGLTAGQLNAIVKKLGGHDRALSFLRGELTVSKSISSWREADGIICFSVTSDGTTGKDWVWRLENKGFRVGDYAKKVLRLPEFKPTSGVTIEVVVLKGMLFKHNDRITNKIRVEADKRKLSKPNAELACLIREKFTNDEIQAMGLWNIVAMHEPINDSGGAPHLLSANCDGGVSYLGAYLGSDEGKWFFDVGFAFAVPQVSSRP